MTPPARDAGVERGQTATQALARCTGVRVRHRALAQETATTDVLLQCAYGFSPHLESTAPGLCTLDLRGLSRLQPPEPDALHAWAQELQSSLSAQGLRSHIGFATTPNLARHAAQSGSAVHVVTDAARFVASLPLAALEPSSDTARILTGWGLRTVGELLALDPADPAREPKQLWRNNQLTPGTASGLAAGDTVYCINRGDVLTAGERATGKRKWQVRLQGPFSTTPVTDGRHLWAVNEAGLVQVVELGETEGKVVSTLDLGDEILCSPAVALGSLFVRSNGRIYRVGK
jgi:hypothetical protein